MLLNACVQNHIDGAPTTNSILSKYSKSQGDLLISIVAGVESKGKTFREIRWRTKTVFRVFCYFPLIASFHVFDAVKDGLLEAGMSRSSPVCGFLPLRSERFLKAKDPNPGKVIFFP